MLQSKNIATEMENMDIWEYIWEDNRKKTQ